MPKGQKVVAPKPKPKSTPGMPSPQPPHYDYPMVYAPPAVSFVAQPDVKTDPWHFAAATILQDRNATVAKVTLVQRSGYNGPADFEFAVTGSSKREKGDKFNARTGELLALSRAYLKLSRDLYAAGRALVEPESQDAEDARLDAELNEWGAAGDELPDVDAREAAALAEEPLAEDVPDPRLQHAVVAFNAAANALNNATDFIRSLTD